MTGASPAPVLATIKGLAKAGVWVEVSTPLIPGFNTGDATVRAMAQWLARVDPNIPWHLLRFSPDFKMRHVPPTSPDTLAHGAALAKEAGLRFVYVERALGEAGRRTDCPRCGETLVSRDIWAVRKVAASSGRCPDGPTRWPGRNSRGGKE